MTMPATQAKQNAETHLQRTLNTALNELGTDSALAAIFHQEQGPLISHASRDRKSTRLNSSHSQQSRMPSSA